MDYLSLQLKLQAINLITVTKTQLSSIVDEIEALKSDVGLKFFESKTELGVDSNFEAFNAGSSEWFYFHKLY